MFESFWLPVLVLLAVVLAIVAGLLVLRWGVRSAARAAEARRERQKAAAELAARLAAEHDQVLQSADALMHTIRELGSVAGGVDSHKQSRLVRSVKDRVTAAQRLNKRAQAMPTRPAELEALPPQEADHTLRVLTKSCEDLHGIRATIERQMRQIRNQAARLRSRAMGSSKQPQRHTAYDSR